MRSQAAMLDYTKKDLPGFYATGMPVLADKSQSVNAKIIAGHWQHFNKNLKTIKTRVFRKNWRKFGITYDVISGKQYMYLAAVETAASEAPADMLTIYIPAMEYLCFTHTGSFWQLKDTYFTIYKQIIPEAALRKLPAADCGIEHLEWYDDNFQWTKADSKIFIYIPIKIIGDA